MQANVKKLQIRKAFIPLTSGVSDARPLEEKRRLEDTIKQTSHLSRADVPEDTHKDVFYKESVTTSKKPQVYKSVNEPRENPRIFLMDASNNNYKNKGGYQGRQEDRGYDNRTNSFKKDNSGRRTGDMESRPSNYKRGDYYDDNYDDYYDSYDEYQEKEYRDWDYGLSQTKTNVIPSNTYKGNYRGDNRDSKYSKQAMDSYDYKPRIQERDGGYKVDYHNDGYYDDQEYYKGTGASYKSKTKEPRNVAEFTDNRTHVKPDSKFRNFEKSKNGSSKLTSQSEVFRKDNVDGGKKKYQGHERQRRTNKKSQHPPTHPDSIRSEVAIDVSPVADKCPHQNSKPIPSNPTPSISQNPISNPTPLLEKSTLYFTPNQSELDQPKKQLRYISEAKNPHVKSTPRGAPLNVLMIAEKPSIALSLANALGRQYESEKGATPIFSYVSDFFGHRSNFKVTSVTGHVFNRDFPEKYQNWTRTDPASLFSAETVKTKADDKGKTVRHLEQVSRNQDVVVLWLDNDREGENICFEILDVVFNNLRTNVFRRIYRARFYSLEATELRSTFLALNEGPDLLMSSAVDGRQILDLKVGVSFTRFQSMYLKERYVEFKDKVVSFGPCQTPTLAFVVNRDKEIDLFVPRKYFKISYMASTSDSANENTTNSSSRDCPFGKNATFEVVPVVADPNFYEKSEAMDYYKKLTMEGTVTEVKVTSEKVEVPSALNTVNLLKHCCKSFNISAHNGLQVAESLYLRGYTTYPRTESTRYPKGFNFRQVVQASSSFDSSKYREWTQELERQETYSPPEGIDMGDHPPIIPTCNVPSSSDLSEMEYKVYEYILKNLLCTISKKPQIEVTTFSLSFGDTKYTLRKKRLVIPSFLKYINSTKYQSCNDAVSLVRGQSVYLQRSPLEERFTCPPKKITESHLLELMDKHGIGTDASMATHINNLIVREYVSVEGSNRTIVSTNLGRRIIDFYSSIDKELISPQLRGNMERGLDRIAKNEDSFEHVVSEMLSMFYKKFLNFKKNIEMLQNSLASDFKTVEQSVTVEGKPFTKCGNCNRFMNYSDYAEIMKCQFCSFKCVLPKCPKPRKLNSTCRKLVSGVGSIDRCCNFQEIQYREKFKLGDQKFTVYITICPNCFVNEVGYYSQSQCRVGKCGRCPKGDVYLASGKNVNEFFFKCSGSDCTYLALVLKETTTPQILVEEKCKCALTKLSFKLTSKNANFKNENLVTACPVCDPGFRESIQDISGGLNVTGRKEHKRFKKGGHRGRKPTRQ